MAPPKGSRNNPNGRNPKELNWHVFEEGSKIHCTIRELCGLLNVDPKTLHTHAQERYGKELKEIMEDFRSSGKESLRRYQLRLAKTNANMAIWLGKNWLGQSDNSQQIVIDPDLAEKMGLLMKSITQSQKALSSKEEHLE